MAKTKSENTKGGKDTKSKPKEKAKAGARTPGFTANFDILSTEGKLARESAVEELQKISEKRTTKPTNFRTMAEVRSILVPLDHFVLQWAIGSRGIPYGSLVQLLGPSATGKSTMGHLLLGTAMRHCRCPVLSIQWRAKPFWAARALRTLSASPEQAKAMLEAVEHSYVSTLQQMELTVDDWIRVWRKKNQLPMATPLWILVGNASKYLNAEEADKKVEWGDHMDDSKKAKETNEGSNFVHAKWFEAWTRKLGDQLPANNCGIIVDLDLKDKPDMSAGGPHKKATTLPQSVTELFSTTHRGGTAIRQMSQLAINFSYKSMAKDPTTQRERGKIVTMRTSKNTCGAEGRKFEGELRSDHARYDCPGYLDPAWHFDEFLANMFAENGYFGVTCTRKRFTSERLGIIGATDVELSNAFHARPELVQELGQELRLEGYYDLVDRLLVDYATPTEAKL